MLLMDNVVSNEFWWLIFIVPLVSATLALAILLYVIKSDGPLYYIYSKETDDAIKALRRTYLIRAVY